MSSSHERSGHAHAPREIFTHHSARVKLHLLNWTISPSVIRHALVFGSLCGVTIFDRHELWRHECTFVCVITTCAVPPRGVTPCKDQCSDLLHVSDVIEPPITAWPCGSIPAFSSVTLDLFAHHLTLGKGLFKGQFWLWAKLRVCVLLLLLIWLSNNSII